MSLRSRLTLLGVATVATAVLAFTFLATARTGQVLERRNREEVAAISNGLLAVARAQVLRVEAGRKPLRYSTQKLAATSDAYVGVAVVVMSDGTQLALPQIGSAAGGPPAVPDDVLDRVGQGPFELHDDGGRFIARVDAVPKSDAALFVALSDGKAAATVSELFRSYLWIGIGLIVAFALMTAAAVRYALGPLRSITAVAGRIASGSTGERAPTARSGTEVGALAQAMNAMLDTVEDDARERERSRLRTERFAADAAHELRTPVAAILGYSELYQQGGVTDAARIDDVFGRIRHEAGRLTDLVEGLLVLNRADRPAEPGEASPVDLFEVCSEVAEDSAAIDPNHPVTVVIEGTDRPGPAGSRSQDGAAAASDAHGLEGGPVAVAVRDQVFQIVANLVANVRAHTPPGTRATITVGWVGGGGVRVDVTDDGPGMDPDLRAVVFDRFSRGEASRSRTHGGGSGLGLAIVEALAKSNGGAAALLADAGPDSTGCTFRVTLPTAG